MKKVLLFLLFIIVAAHVFAGGVVVNYRWRNNDGTEKTATWKGAQNTIVTISDTGIVRLRIAFIYSGKISPILGYSTSVEGSSTNITNSTSNAFAFSGNTVYLTNLAPTTSQIRPQGTVAPFTPGRIVTVADTITVNDTSSYTENEYSLKITKNIQPGTTYYFYGDVDQSSYAGIYPVIQTSNDINHPGDIVTGYSFTAEPGNQVILNFTTAVSGHDHFDLQYSKDDQTWTTYKTLPGDNVQSHQTTFNKPPRGTYYGRILLYDLKDVMSISPTIQKTIDVNGDTSSISPPVTQSQATALSLNVYPNPANANVSFDLKGYTGKTFTATMTSLYGKPMGTKTFVVNPEQHYTLESTASTGTYILNINGDNLAKSSRVLVQ